MYIKKDCGIFVESVVFIPRHTKGGGVLCYTLRTLSACPSVCPSALRFRALTLVPFHLFSSDFAYILVSGGVIWDCKWATFVLKQQSYDP